MTTEKHELKNKRQSKSRGPVVLALVVAAIGILSLGVFTVLGTPGTSGIDGSSERDSAGTAAIVDGAGGIAVALDVQRIELPDGPAFVLALGAMAPTDESATLRFNSGQLYDFVVSQGGREVWRWSAGRAFHQAIHDRTVDAGTLQTFVEVWDGRDAQGELVVGDVTVRASLQTTPLVETNSVQLTIDDER